MKLTRPSVVKELLESLQLKPNKTLGQNFLIDGNILRMIVALAKPEPEETILEIGPGLGVMTEALLEKAGKVIAVEKDPVLCAHLRNRFKDVPNLELHEADALEIDLASFVAHGAKRVISNLPYVVGNRILVDLISAEIQPDFFLLMTQKDVARRLVSPPHSKEYGFLSIVAQIDYQIKIEKEVSPNCFLPVPKVWSAVISLTKRQLPLVQLVDRAFHRQLVKWVFSYRRKQMASIFRHPPEFVAKSAEGCLQALDALNIDHRTRPEDLSVEKWGQLANLLRS